MCQAASSSGIAAASSLLAPGANQTYEHQQGRKLLADVEYVLDYVEMRRFDDDLLVEVLEAMRTRGGRQISQTAWVAITHT